MSGREYTKMLTEALGLRKHFSYFPWCFSIFFTFPTINTYYCQNLELHNTNYFKSLHLYTKWNHAFLFKQMTLYIEIFLREKWKSQEKTNKQK